MLEKVLGRIELLLQDTPSALILKSLKVIKKAFELYGINNVSISFNGGKDCTVLLFLAIYAAFKWFPVDGQRFSVIYIIEEEQFDEIDAFINEIEISIPQISLVRMQGSLRSACEVYLRENPSIQAILEGTRYSDPFSGN